jgi:transposase-like protein
MSFAALVTCGFLSVFYSPAPRSDPDLAEWNTHCLLSSAQPLLCRYATLAPAVCRPMRRKLPVARLKEIPVLLEQGMSVAEIASKIGCTVGTLRVKCSQLGISLRRSRGSRLTAEAKRYDTSRGGSGSQRRRIHRQETAESAWQSRALRSVQPTALLGLRLSRRLLNRLRQRAAAKGVSDAQLVAMLIEVIDRDDLYEAVMDVRKPE